MLAATRRAAIAELVRSRRTMTNEALAGEVGVSVETIRRDLDRLDREGTLERVRGGAMRTWTSRAAEPSFPARRGIAAAEKRSIAQHALDFLDGARTIFIDIGTTATSLAEAFAPQFCGTVVTPSMRVAELLSESPNIEVLVPGGKVRSGDMSISGPSARSFLQDINPDLAFIGTGGVDLQAGITDFDLVEVEVKHTMIANSDRSYALADSTKFSTRAPYRVCDLSNVTAILTDPGVDHTERSAFEAAGFNVLSPLTGQ